MSQYSRFVIAGVVAVVVVSGLLYLAGFRIVSADSPLALSSATEQAGRTNKPGWRRSGETLARAKPPGSSPRSNAAKKMSSNARKGGDQRGQRQASGRQPGFGPQGGILLPMKTGQIRIPVVASGKERASFVGKDLLEHVEDTVVATAEGPRKGWAIAKTLAYLGIENYSEAILLGRDGANVVISLEQIQDTKTIPLFTYDDQGVLMVVSGPKVRGTNQGKISLEEVKQLVSGRTDLLNIIGIKSIEVSS